MNLTRHGHRPVPSPTTRNRLSLHIKERNAAGSSQRDLAELLHISTEGYGTYEPGDKPASLLKLNRLATIFHSDMSELVVEAGTSLTAQALRIANLLDRLSSGDRDEIIKIVKRIYALSHKKHTKIFKPYQVLPPAHTPFKNEIKQASVDQLFLLRHLGINF